MDRHDVPGITKEELDETHRKDLLVEHEYGLKTLTYWFDINRGNTFCLVDAPTGGALKRLHEDSHGSVPTKIIEVDPDAVEMFLGRVQDLEPDERGKDGVDSAFRAIMFTDLVDFTSTTVRLGDDRAMELLRMHNDIVREELLWHGGREVKHTGDGLMASFSLADQAVKSGSEIQRRFSLQDAQKPDDQLHLRVGIAVGEPVEDHGDLFGASVQLAARMCALAEPDQILLSADVIGCIDPGEFRFSDSGLKHPKGFAEGVQTFEVDWRSE